jgi:DNA-binding transcriptional LysR family regulator
MKIDPRLLVEFSVVAQEGSFTGASARLRIAQPWLSTRMRKLEGLVGFALFERTTRNVTLTSQGAEMLELAVAVASASAEFEVKATGLRRNQEGTFRIGAPPYTRRLVERRCLIERFATDHPHTRLELETGWSLVLQDRLADGHLDLAIVMGDFDAGLFEAVVLRKVGLALFMPREHRWAGNSQLSPDDLDGETIRTFTRSLNPRLWDLLHGPLRRYASIVEDHDMAEGPPLVMSASDGVVAFFDFGPEAVSPGTCSVPLAGNLGVPLHLLRRKGATGMASALWDYARGTI